MRPTDSGIAGLPPPFPSPAKDLQNKFEGVPDDTLEVLADGAVTRRRNRSI